MIVLATADIHGNWDAYRWLVGVVQSRKPDVLVMAGDLLGAPDSYDTALGDQQYHAEVLVELLLPVTIPVLYVMGNDDWVELPTQPGWHQLHLRRLDVGEFNFVGYQNTTRFMGGPNERSEEEMESELAGIQDKLDSRTVLVTHGPTQGVLDGGHGSTALAELLKRWLVHAHVHGHSHDNFGRSGKHYNVAAGEQRRAMLIDLVDLSHEVIQGRL